MPTLAPAGPAFTRQDMGFADAISACFAKYATFSGRARRAEYWYWFLFSILAGAAAGILGTTLFGGAGLGLRAIVSLALFLPGLAVYVRRLHDTDHSGWWMLIVFTIIGAIPLLIWLCTEGTQGANQFGARTT